MTIAPDRREPSITVRVPSLLAGRTGGQRMLHVTGETVREVIDALERAHPGIRFHICHETGELRPYVNVFVEQEDVRFLQGLYTPVSPGATIHIIHSVAGGSR